jgi:hypothetical protein
MVRLAIGEKAGYQIAGVDSSRVSILISTFELKGFSVHIEMRILIFSTN